MLKLSKSIGCVGTLRVGCLLIRLESQLRCSLVVSAKYVVNVSKKLMVFRGSRHNVQMSRTFGLLLIVSNLNLLLVKVVECTSGNRAQLALNLSTFLCSSSANEVVQALL